MKLDELEEIRHEAYENVMIYKERTKRYHDKNLTRREFQIRQKDLLYNSRLRLIPDKLKSRWSSPFIVNKVFVNGVMEIHDTRDYHTFTVNCQILKIYSGCKILVEKVSLIFAEPEIKNSS